MDQSRFIAKHVVNLPKSGIRDFFDIVAKMKDAIGYESAEGATDVVKISAIGVGMRSHAGVAARASRVLRMLDGRIEGDTQTSGDPST